MNQYDIEEQEIMERIARHCPEAMCTYIQCINRANKVGTVFFSHENIDIDMSENFDRFRNNIKKLARENLLEWHPLDGGISVTLAIDYEDEGIDE